MYKIFASFFAFLAPIVRKALIQVAADELSRVAYPDRRHARRTTPTKRQSIINVGKAVREADAAHTGFHDVLLVAFDLRGPSSKNVQEWLMDNLPEPGVYGELDEIDLDSWWIANDERYDRSDTDSAVFVAKGRQEAARAFLRGTSFVS